MEEQASPTSYPFGSRASVATEFFRKRLHAAPDINIRNYASPMVTTGEIIASIASLQAVAAILLILIHRCPYSVKT